MEATTSYSLARPSGGRHFSPSPSASSQVALRKICSERAGVVAAKREEKKREEEERTRKRRRDEQRREEQREEEQGEEGRGERREKENER